MAAQIRQTVVDVPAERPKPARPKAKKRTGEQLLDEQGNIDTSTLRKLAPNVAEQEAMMTIRRFQQFDELHGGKGELDEEDVLKLLNDLLKDRLGQLVIQRLTKYQFAIADRDKNGTLNLEEFMTIFAFIMEQCPKGSQKAEDTLAGLSANQKPKPEQRKSNSNSLESSARSVIVESTVVPKYVPEPAPAAAAPAPPPRAPEPEFTCPECKKLIDEGRVVKFEGQKWHKACWVCWTCKGPLPDLFKFEGNYPVCDGCHGKKKEFQQK